MEKFFKSQLPPAVADLVERIEVFAMREISVVVDSRPVSSTSPNPERLAAQVTDTEAKILLRSRETFPPHDVLHELLHIERFWIEGVPQVVPKYDARRVNVTSAIENALEHLVIVPREADYGFDPYPYWNETVRRNWAQYPWPTISDAPARRLNCLLGWLTASHLVSDREVRSHVEECLNREGLRSEAQKFSDRVDEKLASKLDAISAALRFLKLPRDEFVAVKINIKEGSRHELPIPLH